MPSPSTRSPPSWAARVFELRTYTAPEGKFGELHTRFRDHTVRMFEKHGMRNVMYLSPMDALAPRTSSSTSSSHKSRDAAKASRRRSGKILNGRRPLGIEANGGIVAKADSQFLYRHRLLTHEVEEPAPCSSRSARSLDHARPIRAHRRRGPHPGAARRQPDAGRPATTRASPGISTVIESKDLSACSLPFRTRRPLGLAQSRQRSAALRRAGPDADPQKKDQAVRELGVGESDYTGPKVVHWHGAVPATHLIQVNVGFGGEYALDGKGDRRRLQLAAVKPAFRYIASRF